MKKILSSLFILILFFVLAWGVAGWYFGKNAETELKTYLSNIEKIPGEKLFRAELLEYKSTLLGAKAKFKISSDTSFLDERLGDFELNARMLNGPIFLHEKDDNVENHSFFEIGTTRWRFDIDELSIENEKREYLSSMFPEDLPQLVIVTDFDNNAHYQSHLKTEFADALISGIYNLENDDNEGEMSINNLQYGSASNRISAPQATISYNHQRGITAAYKPGITNITIPELEFSHPVLDKPLVLNFIADAAVQSEEKLLSSAVTNGSATENKATDILNGLLKISVKKVSEPIAEHYTNKGTEQNSPHPIPLEKADIKIHFDKIPAEAFIALSEEKAKEDNLYQQIQWTLEESAELPEGQDQIRALNDRLQEMNNQLATLLDNSFSIKESQIRLNVSAENKTQKSTLIGKIRLNKKARNPENVFHLLMGDAKVILNKELFTFLKPLAELHSPTFELTLQNGKLSLNN